ncbi:response regulator [candidate division KSB1 bacterium]|nr:response regulator [candidate division KSB1 bacterium]
MAKTILIIDDEQDIIDLLQFNLQAEGYQILSALEGETAIELAQKKQPDLIILDIMLPGKDGYEVIRELRQDVKTKQIPVIFLTAKDSEIDEVIGLELGADDYIVKPIGLRKLVARVKMVLRKTSTLVQEQNKKISHGNLLIDAESYSVKVNRKPVDFTKKEFEILSYLAQRPGRVVTRETLLNEVWGEDVIVIDRTIDVHIRKIREKLEDYSSYIETIKGVGYRFKTESQME